MLKIGLYHKEVKFNSKKATYFILYDAIKSNSENGRKAEKYLCNKYLQPEIFRYIGNDYNSLFDPTLYESEFIQSAKNYSLH